MINNGGDPLTNRTPWKILMLLHSGTIVVRAGVRVFQRSFSLSVVIVSVGLAKILKELF